MRAVIKRLLFVALLATTANVAGATGVLNVLLGIGTTASITYIYNGSITGASNCPGAGEVGFYTAMCGAASPISDSNGHVIGNITYASVAPACFLSIAAASNPGQSYFQYFISNGYVFYASGATYNYNSGFASWEWTSPNVPGPCAIVGTFTAKYY